ncbi:MAG: hypothetical protein LBG47_05090 [Prevotellaceae bacterium]|jgi:hypothetical protein|nr:hypothetical protein [Prevotellaceae bacterium]
MGVSMYFFSGAILAIKQLDKLCKATKVHKIPQLRAGAKRLIFFEALGDMPKKYPVCGAGSACAAGREKWAEAGLCFGARLQHSAPAYSPTTVTAFPSTASSLFCAPSSDQYSA